MPPHSMGLEAGIVVEARVGDGAAVSVGLISGARVVRHHGERSCARAHEVRLRVEDMGTNFGRRCEWHHGSCEELCHGDA